MTFSIIARDPETQAIGVATATGSLAVGGFVPHVSYDLGALATQGAFTNWIYAEKVLSALREGKKADEALLKAVVQDDGSSYRQLIVMDRWGNTAGHTGASNLASKLHKLDANFAVAGNMLSADQVVEAMFESYQQTITLPIHERLLRALEAADQQGGDFRGIHSSAIKVHYFDRPPLDLRVDWADSDCIEQLRFLYEKSLSQGYQGFIQGVPTYKQPSKHGVISSDEV